MTKTKKSKTEEQLREEAERYDMPLAAYRSMTGPERGAMVKRWRAARKAEAREQGVPVAEWEALSSEERERRKQTHTSIESVVARHVAEDPEASEEEAPEPVKIYTDRSDVPATERDPLRRDGMTIGAIEEKAEPRDLIGNNEKPRTLLDLYARWPVGDGQHFLRVERVSPKVSQGIGCNGYIGSVHHKMSESEFAKVFGGKEYDVTLYGPDPRGHQDPDTGNVRIKALTHPIRITVPIAPPNLAYIPKDVGQENNMSQMNQWNPFGATMSQGPMTPAEAQAHKTSVDFATNLLKFEQENLRTKEQRAVDAEREARAKAEEAKKAELDAKRAEIEATSSFFEKQLEQLARQAEARERALIAEKRAADEQLEKVREEIKHATGRSDGTVLELMKEFTRSSADRENGRLGLFEQQLAIEREQNHRQLTALREQHENQRAAMEERHRAEISRADDRLKDAERLHAARLEEERRHAQEREKALKDEIERVRNDARRDLEARLADAKERTEERIRDQEKAHERELRTLRETYEGKVTTEVSMREFKIINLQERVEALKEAEQEARAKAEENNDPIAVLNKAKEHAEALGYKKEDDGPKTATDRFVTAAGAGFGQFVANFDKVLAVWRQQQPQPGPLNGAGQHPQLNAPQPNPAMRPGPPQQQRRRGAQWAERNVVPVPTSMPSSPLGFQADPAAEPTQPAQPPEAPPPPDQPQQPAPEAPAAPAVMNPLGAVFPNEVVLGFLSQVDQAINAAMPPEYFGSQFLERYPAEAMRLVQVYQPRDVQAFVQTLPNSTMSAILRRDGTAFLEGLWKTIQEKSAGHNAGQAAPAAPPN